MDNEFGSAQPVADSERVGFCQDCGQPLTRETVRTIGSAMFCEPHFEARVAAANAAAGAAAAGAATGAGWTTVPPVTPGAGPVGSSAPNPGSMPPGVFPALGGDTPSPGLAALLGFIPGVGAIYNGQFAKGIAHIVIFAFLSSLGHSSDFFSFLAFLWCCYQSYEAYHTAKARREGLPLPDPFGLNDIGERMGMGKGWPGNSGSATGSAGGQASSYPGWTGYVPPAPVPNPYAAPNPYASAPVPTPVAAYETPTQEWGSTPANSAAVAGSVTGAASAAAWETAPLASTPSARASRFPAGAVWLIGLGLLFLLFNLEPDWRFSVNKIVPFFLMALAVWIFAKRLMETGGAAPREGEGAGYGARVVASLRAPAVLFTIGLLMALQTFSHDHDLRFWRTAPVLLVVLGVVLLVERSMSARAYLGQAPVDPSAANPADTTGKGY